MGVKLQSSSGGSVEIAAPVTASNYVLTAPAATDTLVGVASAQTLTNKTLTSPTIDSASVPTVSGTAPLYMCRAWVNFNGTGTVAIRASGNVSSITDNGTGLYTVNFTTAMVDANYSPQITSSDGAWGQRNFINAFGTNYVQIAAISGATNISFDPEFFCVTIQR